MRFGSSERAGEAVGSERLNLRSAAVGGYRIVIAFIPSHWLFPRFQPSFSLHLPATDWERLLYYHSFGVSPSFRSIMSWLRRLSRDRNSKVDQDPPMPSRPFPNNVADSPSQPYKDTQYSSGFNSQDKLQSYRPSTAGEPQYHANPRAPALTGDATNRNISSSMEPTPDPLTKAFNDAIRPYQDQIEDLKNQLEDSHDALQRLEDERADMHAWIDKRGLRAGIYQISHDLLAHAD